MSRVFIVGWDGATFDLIKPWVAEGRLPNIAALLAEGTHGLLRSTMPPMTFPAWSSFMTGKNPGKHGIFDFTRPRPGTYELEFVNGGRRQTPSFWQILSRHGKRVISISVPCTFPPEKVNGVMISGFDAAGVAGSSANVDARGMYPPELYDELEKAIGGHPIGSFPIQEINRNRPDLAIERIVNTVKKKSATAKYLMAHHSWDCMMILFGESDMVGHQCWKYHDPASPLFTENPPGQRDSIFKVYEELDRQLGELRQALPKETTLLLMSDHGFGGVSNCILYPNCWLRERGFLKFRGAFSRRLSQFLDRIKLMAVASLPNQVKAMIYRLTQRRLGRLEAAVRFGMIDWAGTEAYFEENPYYPFLWINLKGRQPKGIVEPGAHYEEVRTRLIAELESWKHPDTGMPIVEKAFRREELYTGAFVNEAPDIIVKWGEDAGYTYAFKNSSKSANRAWTEKVDPNTPESFQFFTGKSGSHRDDGVFLSYGATICQGKELQGAKIIDIAPTILQILGVPVPKDMDGTVLKGIFTDEFSNSHSASSTPDNVSQSDENSVDYTYTPEDEEIIAERLKNLGYI